MLSIKAVFKKLNRAPVWVALLAVVLLAVALWSLLRCRENWGEKPLYSRVVGCRYSTHYKKGNSWVCPDGYTWTGAKSGNRMCQKTDNAPECGKYGWSKTDDERVVKVYSDIDYKGESKTFDLNSGENGLVANLDDWGDRISSVKISNGRKLHVYEHPDFNGKWMGLEGNIPDLRYYEFGHDEGVNLKRTDVQCDEDGEGCWSDIISSLKVVRHP